MEKVLFKVLILLTIIFLVECQQQPLSLQNSFFKFQEIYY